MKSVFLGALLSSWLISPVGLIAQESEHLRKAKPASCFLYDWGKGPNGFADLIHEFRLSLLDRWQPIVDPSTVAVPESFHWGEAQTRPKITTLIYYHGRRIVRIEHFETSDRPEKIPCVMLVAETSQGSEWFRPFVVVQPELYSDTVVAGENGGVAVVATLKWSGTGALRTHHVFDLSSPHPKQVAEVSAGRVRSVDFDSEAKYEEALTIFDREAAIFRGDLDVLKNRAK